MILNTTSDGLKIVKVSIRLQIFKKKYLVYNAMYVGFLKKYLKYCLILEYIFHLEIQCLNVNLKYSISLHRAMKY